MQFAKLDVEEDMGVPARFGVQAMPTLLLFKDGKECARGGAACEQSEGVYRAGIGGEWGGVKAA